MGNFHCPLYNERSSHPRKVNFPAGKGEIMRSLNQAPSCKGKKEVYSFQGTWSAIIIYKSVLEKATGEHLMAKPIVV